MTTLVHKSSQYYDYSLKLIEKLGMLPYRNSNKMLTRVLTIASLLAITSLALYGRGVAQTATPIVQENTSSVIQSDKSSLGSEDEYFRNIYRKFYETYRLGPGDEIAIRVFGQPDYSLAKIKVSPVGRIYHPLVGDIEVVGYTIPQLEKKLTTDFSEYVINPKVSVSLEEAQSAKIGVLGEVRAPSILIMSRPMTILEVINSTGGFTETANRRDVMLLRQNRSGIMQHIKVDIKKILDGKAGPEDNIMVIAGDVVMVNSNFKKKMGDVMNSLRLVNFLGFLVYGRY